MMNKIIRLAITVLLVFSALSTVAFAATSAVEEDFNTRHSRITIPYTKTLSGGIMCRQGGTNKIDGVKCVTFEDVQQLEQLLKVSGYVLVNTDKKEITDEEYALLTNTTNTYYRIHGFSYMKPASYVQEYGKNDIRVYMERKILNTILGNLKNDEIVLGSTREADAITTVFVNYDLPFQESLAWTITNFFNNNIPDWYTHTGFVQIESPIDARVLLKDKYTQTISELFVHANDPLLVELYLSDFTVIEINDKDGIGVMEDSISYYNQVSLKAEDTKDNPHILNLDGVVAKYNIQPIDLDGAPDHSWENKDNDDYQSWLPTDSTVVSEPTQDKQVSKKVWQIIVIGIIIVAIIVGIIILHRLKKKYREG